MRFLFSLLLGLLSSSAFGEPLYWYDDDRRVVINGRTYDAAVDAYVYRFGSSSNAPKHQLTGNIIVKFSGTPGTDSLADFQARYAVNLVKMLRIGSGYYLFSTVDKEFSLDIANQMYLDSKVRFAYPDWLTLGK